MRLHHDPAVLHFVMFEVVFVLEGDGGGGGGGLEYGLHNRAEKSFDHQMSHGKSLPHTNSVFLKNQQCIMNVKPFTLPWEL